MLTRYVEALPELEGAFGYERHAWGDGLAAYYTHFGAYYAALAALELPEEQGRPILRRIVNAVRSHQRSDGSVRDGTCHTPLYQTAYAIRILALTDR